MTATAGTRPQRLQLLDCLRFLAAISVVAFHWLYGGIANGKVTSITHSPAAEVASYGYLGVHLFFLVSGFVIAASVQGKSPARFAVGRLVRLYPAFWFAMLFTALAAVVIGGSVASVTGIQVLANMTIVSTIFGQPYVDGVYWTLFHELVFYVAVFAIMAIGFKKHMDVIFPAWAVLMLILSFATPGLASRPLCGTLYAFFAGGAIISVINRKGWSWWQAIGLFASVYTAIAYMVKDVAGINTERVAGEEQSIAITVVIVLAFYATLIAQTLRPVQQWKIPASQLLGGLTYPVYLLHATFGYMVFERFSNEENKWLVYALTLAVVVALAYLLHKVVELRLRGFWLRIFDALVGRPLEIIAAAFAKRLTAEPSPKQTPALPAQETSSNR